MMVNRRPEGQTTDAQRLVDGMDLHLDHYGGRQLDLAVIGGDGIWADAVVTAGPRRGELIRAMDASGTYASACLGAAHPVVADALATGLAAGQATDEIGAAERSEFLLDLLGPDGLLVDHFAYGDYVASGRSSGSEGLELALRLVLESRVDMSTGRAGPRAGRDTVLAFEGAWHGWTGGLLPLLNRRHYRRGLPIPDTAAASGLTVRHIPFGDEDALHAFIDEYGNRLLATVIEPIQGDAGILEPPDGYLREVADLTARAGGLLVADEVLTFAKTGALLAMRDSDGPVPTDVTVVGKSIGMGAIPFSVVIARRELRIRTSGAVSTNDLRPLACSVARHGLRHIHDTGLLASSAERGDELISRMNQELVGQRGHLFREVRGTGALLGVEMTELGSERIPALRRSLAEHGVLVEFMAGAGRRSRNHRYVFPTLRIVPPLTITSDESAELVDRLARGIDAFEAAGAPR
ncbi:aminotransferase class III-fold pyridoxal phosphate-dependent enzyme [Nocardia sp. 004]|uniref:aminotransferase class III-fold pyridoxal phosphate-dependent enzyme n=1 Tax=Nocardia sp. 004 TaxID=3385978 RepID=UPI0039A1229E